MRNTKILALAIAFFFVVPIISGLSLLLLSSRVSWAGEDIITVGERLYGQFCSQCHGEKGKGDGENAESLDPVPRDMTDSDEVYMAKLTNEEIIEVITKGGAGIDKSPKMPPFGMTLSEYEIAGLCDFVRTRHPNNAEQVDHSMLSRERPKTELREVEIGNPKGKRALKIAKRYYKKYGCAGCHKIRGKGGTSAPELSDVGSRLKAQEIFKVIKDPFSMKEDSRMPVYGLDDDTVVFITQYLLTLQ